MPREDSARSDRRGFRLASLPAVGYDGQVPVWPISDATPRELEVWEWAWRLPQGQLWATPGEHWRWHTIALWVRISVRCEAPDVSAAHLAQLHRFADQIGMTDAGLAAMGYKVATSDPAQLVHDRSSDIPDDPRDRLTVVPGHGAIAQNGA